MTRLMRFNANLTVHYWHSRRQTPLTPNAIIDSGAQYHSHQNFTVCRNYTNLVSQCDLMFLSVVLRQTNCVGTWRQHYNYSPRIPDVNYNPPRTSLTLLRLYRYLKTTNWCYLMWNRFLQVSHFNWHYNVLRLLSYNLPTLYRYRQRTLWTY